MVDTTDILRKAAEDVQQGMWCKGDYFQGAGEGLWPERLLTTDSDSDLAAALASRRCATGSLAVAARLLGATFVEFQFAYSAAVEHVWQTTSNNRAGVIDFNDKLPDDPFEAGQQLAELFRSTADSL